VTKAEIPNISIALINVRLKKVINETFEDMGFSPQTYDLDAIISPAQLRNILIRQEYLEQRQEGIKAERLYHILADKYDLNYKSIMSIVHRKR